MPRICFVDTPPFEEVSNSSGGIRVGTSSPPRSDWSFSVGTFHLHPLLKLQLFVPQEIRPEPVLQETSVWSPFGASEHGVCVNQTWERRHLSLERRIANLTTIRQNSALVSTLKHINLVV